MEITFLYNKNQKELLSKQGVKADVIYFLRGNLTARLDWRKADKTKLEIIPGLIDILKEIELTKRMIDPLVDEYVNSINDDRIKEIVEYVTKSPSWRERPLIMRLATKALGHELSDAVIHAAVAIELFEESAILLDDVLDEAEMCVNKKTAWRKYGIKETFIAHGILSSLARRALLESLKYANLASEKSIEIMRLFEEIYRADYIGQYIDIKSEKQVDFSVNDYFEMISKTPGTQFGNALEIVCILTGNEELKGNLKQFGKLFGMAAQLRDDIIDIIGDEEVVYKKLFTDIIRKKKRLPLILLLKKSPKYQEILKNSISNRTLLRVIKDMKDLGILKTCMDSVKDLTDNAVKHLTEIKDGHYKRLLEQLTLMLSNFGEN